MNVKPSTQPWSRVVLQLAEAGAARPKATHSGPTMWRAGVAAPDPAPRLAGKVVTRFEPGDGRNPKARAWAIERHERAVAATVAPYPEVARVAFDYAKELVPANPRPVADDRGREVRLGPDLRMIAPDGTTDVLVPASMVPPGQVITGYDISRDGKYVAFGTQGQGDLQTWRVIDAASKADVYPEPIVFNNFGETAVRFASDSRSIFYSGHSPAGRKAPRSILHRELAANAEAVEIFNGASVLPHYALPIGPDRAIAIASISVPDLPGFPVYSTVVGRDAKGGFRSSTDALLPAGLVGRVISADADRVIYQTASTVGRFALVAFDPNKADAGETLVPVRHDESLQVCSRVGDKLLTFYLHDDQTWRLRIFALDGTELRTVEMSELGMPARGSPSAFTGNSNSSSFSEFSYSGALTPPTTFRIDLATLAITKRASAREIDFDATQFEQSYQTVRSRDGAELPLHLIRRKVIPEGQERKVWVTAYGSLGDANTPAWDRYTQLLLAADYDVAFAGIRGGGERGSDWRDAGSKNRMLTINDLADVGHQLRQRGYETRIAYGRSWGGWLMENVAIEDAKAYTRLIASVPAGDAERLLRGRDSWGLHDLGAEMGLAGEAQNHAHALRQAARFSTPARYAALATPPRILLFAQLDDDRAEPGSPMRSMTNLEARFGTSTDSFHLMAAPGGHFERGDMPYLVPYLYHTTGKQNVVRPPRRRS